MQGAREEVQALGRHSPPGLQLRPARVLLHVMQRIELKTLSRSSLTQTPSKGVKASVLGCILGDRRLPSVQSASLIVLLPQVNIGVFLAELFLCFEVLKPEFVCPKELSSFQGKKVTCAICGLWLAVIFMSN